MPTRRGSRSSHVRPRPPSTGRPAPQRTRVPAPDAYRLKQARGLGKRRKGIPLPARALLVVALLALGGAVFLTATGSLSVLVQSVGNSLAHVFDRIAATPAPSSTQLIVADAPVIASPDEPYTNQPSADLQITVPSDLIGDPAARVRIYLTLEGQAPAPIKEVPLGGTIHLIVPVDLSPGRNDLYGTIVDAGLESEASPIVTFILDTDPPVIVVSSPKDGATINRGTVTIKGTTQPRTTLLARNEANGTSVSGQAGSDGTFSLEVTLEPGPNGVRIAATDPAGNAGELILSVVRGNGTLTSTLTSSAYRVSTSSLPVAMQLSVLVTDPDGHPLEGAAVTFTLTIPGIPPVAKDAITGGDGRATFTTTLPTGVTTGTGLATVLVATDNFGSTSSQKTITIVK
jgi:Glucodextranase, domain B